MTIDADDIGEEALAEQTPWLRSPCLVASKVAAENRDTLLRSVAHGGASGLSDFDVAAEERRPAVSISDAVRLRGLQTAFAGIALDLRPPS